MLEQDARIMHLIWGWSPKKIFENRNISSEDRNDGKSQGLWKRDRENPGCFVVSLCIPGSPQRGAPK
jgi:hypothetical protein